MKKLPIILCSIFLLALISCSRKRIPQKTPTTTFDTSTTKNNSQPVLVDSAKTADSGKTINEAAARVMVVADGYGRLITQQQNLPEDSGISYDNLQLSKGFTTQQRANMQARYKTIPPRVLYVPQPYVRSSLKGSYYIFKNKFWYWKKPDGLFYLDEKYYL